jgi:hypothetical protein
MDTERRHVAGYVFRSSHTRSSTEYAGRMPDWSREDGERLELLQAPEIIINFSACRTANYTLAFLVIIWRGPEAGQSVVILASEL